jgi:hypothetical protein
MIEETKEKMSEAQKTMNLTSPMTGIPRRKSLFSTQPSYFQQRQPKTEPKILSELIQLE